MAEIPLNPLSAAFRGFQGAQQRALQQAQQMEENALTQQLRQIQLLNAQRQLAEASKTPQQRFAEQFAQAVAMDALKSGAATASPVGFEGQPVYEPFAIGQTAEQLAAAEAASQAPLEQAALSNLIAQQIAPGEVAGVPPGTGLGEAMSNILSSELPTPDAPAILPPQAPRQPFIAPRARQAQVAMPLAAAPGFISSPAAERATQAADLESARQGLALKQEFERPKIHKVGNDLYQENPVTGDLDKVVSGQEDLQLKKILQTDGQFHQAWVNKQGDVVRDLGIMPATGRGTSGESGSGGVAGGLKATGEEAAKFRQTIDLMGQMDDAITTLNEIERTGQFPGGSENALNTFLAQRPQDIPGAGVIPGLSSIYAYFQTQARGAQTPAARQAQMRKAMIASTIIRTQAGLSQTLGEIVNVAPYTPSETDTYESLMDKLNLLKAEGTRALKTYQRVYPAMRDVAIPEIEQTQPAKKVPTTKGSEVTQDGKTYKFDGSKWNEVKK